MKKLFLFVLVVAVLAGATLYVQSVTNPCNKVIEYSLGSFDNRFGISPDEFLDNIKEMERVWEEPLGQELFLYNPNAAFKINLVFDDRQAKTIAERDARQTINLSEQSYEKLVAQYNNLNYQYQQSLVEYNQQRQEYEARLSKYTAEVSHWNKQGGASSDDYKRLNQEKKDLATLAIEIERERITLNATASDLNNLAAKINTLAKQLNVNVNDYNGKFGQSRQFDQGTYTGNAINVYQFNEISDLRLVIAHELGHALTLEHINDQPSSVMYYLMGEQDLENIHLTNADLLALKNVCRMK